LDWEVAANCLLLAAISLF